LEFFRNQKKFIDEISNKYQIKTQKEWKKITIKEMIGNVLIASKYHG